jgi:two-component system cell cycle response regulator DivK
VRHRILLVEDNEVNAEMLTRRLERRGFTVLVARDGREAIAAAEREQPSLILMDMSLPEVDGWEATRRLKANPITAPIPVIALTAHAMSSDRDRCLAAGCEDFDTKPVDFARLLDKMQAVLPVARA